jgi:hypothetical protein
MNIDLEDALELANRNHQLCLKKKKEKYRQSRLDHQDFDFIESYLSPFQKLCVVNTASMNIDMMISMPNWFGPS